MTFHLAVHLFFVDLHFDTSFLQDPDGCFPTEEEDDATEFER
jgi:hypothetical protein